MIPEVAQLVVPNIRWEDAISGMQHVLDGRSVVSSLDAKRLPIGDLASFLGVLSEFKHEGSDPEAAVREFTTLRLHLWFSFLVQADLEIENELRQAVLGVHILQTRMKLPHFAAVLSGTLDEWQRTIQCGLVEESSRDLRILFGKLYLWFVSQGLGPMWGVKQELGDGTFIVR